MNKIKSIEEYTEPTNKWSVQEGYQIVTDDHTYLFTINNGQDCCEEWGYICSEDDFSKFVGADVLKVNLTDVACETIEVPELEDGDVQFVNFYTDRGLLQFAVYNSHNGYYGHSMEFKIDDGTILERVL